MNTLKVLSIFTALPFEKHTIEQLESFTNLPREEIEKELVLLRNQKKIKGVKKMSLAGELLKRAKGNMRYL